MGKKIGLLQRVRSDWRRRMKMKAHDWQEEGGELSKKTSFVLPVLHTSPQFIHILTGGLQVLQN